MTRSALLNRVAEVADLAARGRPARQLSMREFDAARHLVAGGHDIPTASAIRRRIRQPWATVLNLAATPKARSGYFLGRRHDRDDELRPGEFDLAEGLRMVRSIADRRGHPPAASEYDQVLRKVMAARRRHRYFQDARWPRSITLVAAHGDDWTAVLAAAGLPPARSFNCRRGIPLSEALDKLIDELDILPPRAFLVSWASVRGIALQMLPRAPWADTIAATRALRASAGKDFPSHQIPARDCPPLQRPVGSKVRRPWTRDDVIASLQRYGARHLTPGALPTQKGYQEARRRDPELVGTGTLTRHGRFQDLCSEAGIA